MLRLWQIPAKPARGSGARILELDIGTTKNEFRACDLPPRGREKKSYRFLRHDRCWIDFGWKLKFSLDEWEDRREIGTKINRRTSNGRVGSRSRIYAKRCAPSMGCPEEAQVRPQYGDSVPPVRGFSRDLFKKRPKF